jgi:putative flippase GtrA
VTSLAREALRYALASGCALLVDVGLLALLVQVLAWWYLAAATVSFTVGAFVAYFISVKLVFTDRRLRDRRAEFLSFMVIGAVGLGINAGVIFSLVKYFGVNYLAAKGAAAGFTFLFNFVARRQLLFVVPSAV